MVDKPARISQMRREINEIPNAIKALITHGRHVCTYLKYACELVLDLPVASVGPSVSQSGQSPDIVAMARGINPDQPRHLRKVTETI